MFTPARPSSMPRGGVRAAPLTPPLSSPLQKGTIDPKRGINGPPSWELGSLSREALERSGVLGRWATLSRPLQGPESAWVGHWSDSSSLEKEWVKWWRRRGATEWENLLLLEEQSFVCIFITLATIEEYLTSMTWDSYALKTGKRLICIYSGLQTHPDTFEHSF